MAEVKISELTSATTPLAGTETVPIVQGGVTKKVAVSEIGGGGGVAWGDITGTLGDQSDLATAFLDVDSAISTKQDTLASTINIKSINGYSVLGSGNLALPGVKGVHVTTKPVSNVHYTNNINTSTQVAFSMLFQDSLYLSHFIPSYDLTVNQMSFYVSTAGAGQEVKLIVFSDLDGYPSSRLLMSTGLSCTTTGIKSYNLPSNYTFTAGTTYWIGILTKAGTGACYGNAAASLMPFGGVANSTVFYNYYLINGLASGTFTYASPPTTIDPLIDAPTPSGDASVPRVTFRKS